MSGAIRFSFDRSPDYFAALRVEGRQTDVLVGREVKTGRLVATGQRSVKTVFVNGKAATDRLSQWPPRGAKRPQRVSFFPEVMPGSMSFKPDTRRHFI